MCVFSCSIISDSFWSHGLWPARLLCPWNFSGKNTGAGSHFLLQEAFLTQRSNLHLLQLLPWKADSLLLCYLGSPCQITIKFLNTYSQSTSYWSHHGAGQRAGRSALIQGLPHAELQRSLQSARNHPSHSQNLQTLGRQASGSRKKHHGMDGNTECGTSYRPTGQISFSPKEYFT